ncbi:MAG: ParB N-terminal domain-containing protein [Planctomycetaceae bacterium]|nr:ParB N-terminal domain-containing protein [Planctomycetaceae bacterium]
MASDRTIAVEYVAPGSLNAAAYNPRKIDRKALAALATLLDVYGFVSPVIARRKDRLLIGGHQRLKANAMRQQPAERVPCVFLDGIDDGRCKALAVALNHKAAQGRFDPEALSEIVADLSGAGLDVPALTALPPREVQDLLALPAELVAAKAPAPAPTPRRRQTVVILEIAPKVYKTLRAQLDVLAAADGVKCHVRTDGAGQ